MCIPPDGIGSVRGGGRRVWGGVCGVAVDHVLVSEIDVVGEGEGCVGMQRTKRKAMACRLLASVFFLA